MSFPPGFPRRDALRGLCTTPVHDGNEEDEEFEMTSWMSSPKTPMLARLAKARKGSGPGGHGDGGIEDDPSWGQIMC